MYNFEEKNLGDEKHPETIYLLDMGDERVWCNYPDSDSEDRDPVEYVRADIAAALRADLAEVRTRAAGLEAALRWYADPGSYVLGVPGTSEGHLLSADKGDRARAALGDAPASGAAGPGEGPMSDLADSLLKDGYIEALEARNALLLEQLARLRPVVAAAEALVKAEVFLEHVQSPDGRAVAEQVIVRRKALLRKAVKDAT